jgi:hypothetical protein
MYPMVTMTKTQLHKVLKTCIDEENYDVYIWYADKFPDWIDDTVFSCHMDTCVSSRDRRWLQAALDANTTLDTSAFQNSSFSWDDAHTAECVRMMLVAGRADLLAVYKDFDRDVQTMTLTRQVL